MDRLRITLRIPYKNDAEHNNTVAFVIDSDSEWFDGTSLTLCTVPGRNLQFFS